MAASTPRYGALQSRRRRRGDRRQGRVGVAARMGLARFLIGSELSYEAIGVLNLLARKPISPPC
jgi:hypothetical protein